MSGDGNGLAVGKATPAPGVPGNPAGAAVVGAIGAAMLLAILAAHLDSKRRAALVEELERHRRAAATAQRAAGEAAATPRLPLDALAVLTPAGTLCADGCDHAAGSRGATIADTERPACDRCAEFLKRFGDE